MNEFQIILNNILILIYNFDLITFNCIVKYSKIENLPSRYVKKIHKKRIISAQV